MYKTIIERIAALRHLMKEDKIDAFIIPTADPHISEYPAACWKDREWISGFTGSSGTVVITATKPVFGPTHAIFCKLTNS